MRITFPVVVGLLAAVTCPAFADTPATEATNLARFEKYAGAPVENFTMWSMYKWQNLGPDQLAVWTKVNEAYLLKVAQPCIRLEDAKGVVVTSQMSHQVNRRLDYVNFRGQHCQIVEIRPLDYKTMIKDGDSTTSK
jgi:siroheme synthase